jgi:hypothetical protein
LPEGFIFYSMCLIYNLSNDCEQDLKSDVWFVVDYFANLEFFLGVIFGGVRH